MKTTNNKNRLTKYIFSFIMTLILFTATVFAWTLTRVKHIDIPVGEPIVLTLEDGELDADNVGKKLIPNGAIKGDNDTYELVYTFKVKLYNPKEGVVLDTVLTIDNPDSSLFEIETNFDTIKADLDEGLDSYLDLVITIKFIDNLPVDTDYTSVIGTLKTVTITINVIVD